MLTTAVHSFEVELVRNITVVCFTIDTLDEQNFETVAEELDALIAARKPRRVVVDLASLRFVDDLGLAVVQSFHDGIEEYGGTAILCRLSHSVASAMNDVGLQRHLHIRPSRNEAVWTF